MTMRDWFADGFGRSMADIRNRLEEFFYERVLTPDYPRRSPLDDRESSPAQRLGWDTPGESTTGQDRGMLAQRFGWDTARESAPERSALDALYKTDPGQFVDHDTVAGRDEDRGIDR